MNARGIMAKEGKSCPWERTDKKKEGKRSRGWDGKNSISLVRNGLPVNPSAFPSSYKDRFHANFNINFYSFSTFNFYIFLFLFEFIRHSRHALTVYLRSSTVGNHDIFLSLLPSLFAQFCFLTHLPSYPLFHIRKRVL